MTRIKVGRYSIAAILPLLIAVLVAAFVTRAAGESASAPVITTQPETPSDPSDTAPVTTIEGITTDSEGISMVGSLQDQAVTLENIKQFIQSDEFKQQCFEAAKESGRQCSELFDYLEGFVKDTATDLQTYMNTTEPNYRDRQECLDVADTKFAYCKRLAIAGAAATVAVATWLTGGVAAVAAGMTSAAPVAAAGAAAGGGTVTYCSSTRTQDHARCNALYPDPNLPPPGPSEAHQLRRRLTNPQNSRLNPQSSPSPQSSVPAFSGAPTKDTDDE